MDDLIELLGGGVFGVLAVHHFRLVVLKPDTGVMFSFKGRNVFFKVAGEPSRNVMRSRAVVFQSTVVINLTS